MDTITKKAKLSQTEQAVLNILYHTILFLNKPPTIREISNYLKHSATPLSPSGANYVLNKLKILGFIKRNKLLARGIQLEKIKNKKEVLLHISKLCNSFPSELRDLKELAESKLH